MVKQHAGTCVAHDGTYLFAHTGVVAMNGALLAGGFSFAVPAMRKVCVSILQQGFAMGAKRVVAFFVPAIEGNHLRYDTLFLFDA